MTSWTSPRTWSTSELVTKAIMDTHVRDNLLHLKEVVSAGLPIGFYQNNAPNYTYTGSSFAIIGGVAVFNITLVAGHAVLYGFSVSIGHNTSNAIRDVSVFFDSIHQGGSAGHSRVVDGNVDTTFTHAATAIKTGLSATTYQFQLTWKTDTGTISTSSTVSLTFWAIELTKQGS